jgi:hypothetical protein
MECLDSPALCPDTRARSCSLELLFGHGFLLSGHASGLVFKSTVYFFRHLFVFSTVFGAFYLDFLQTLILSSSRYVHCLSFGFAN